MSADVSAVLAKHRHDPTRLVQILRDVMASEGHLAPRTLTAIAEGLGVPRGRVEGVAGFYAFFSTEPRVKYRVLFSDGVTDRMAGSVELRQRMLDAFRVRLDEPSPGGLVSIGTTSCAGLCDQGPSMLVNGLAIPRLTHARIGAISALIRASSPMAWWPENLFPVHSHVERRDVVLSTPFACGDGVAAAIRRGPDATLDELLRSGLRGRGGAGFSTATKWTACRGAEGHAKYVVCNADEGEPGTFKDRVLLADHLDLVLDGMTIAAHTIGAQKGFLYLRGEYPFLVEPILAALDRRRRERWLGPGIAGTSFEFDIDLHVGAGAYVCGEESALIESLEGKRGIPRNRPPYPVTHGYLDQPTVVNNVETLAKCALIAVHGAAWFKQRGTAKSTGTKLLSVSGDVARPGIYEFGFGVTAAEVLEAAGATRTQAVQVGGPSGTLLAKGELGRRIAFEDVPSAGAFIAFDESRDLLEVVESFASFFAHEACGFCTPCRVGTTLLAQAMGRICHGKGTRRDVKDLARVAKLLRATSHCGLGQTAGNPVLFALEKLKPAFEAAVASHEVRPMFDLDEALAPAREITGREDEGAHLVEEDA
jgi:[NiFe] hydrogenase diaphorase moiety large subunit